MTPFETLFHDPASAGERLPPSRDATTRKREIGTISSFDPIRGWGFIARDGDRDLFFHVDCFNGKPGILRAGDRVGYVVGRDRVGRLCAQRIVRK
jgi:cold shock CspA family protein